MWLPVLRFYSTPSRNLDGVTMKRPFMSIIAIMLVVGVTAAAHAEDVRSYMHGIDAVKRADGRYWVFFSSSGLPPTGPDEDGAWQHDVYVSDWGTKDGNLKSRLFIGQPEAQEPASAAITSNGHIMVTFEDGWQAEGGVTQRYGVYNSKMKPIAAYPRTVEKGGHSGHVTAVGNNFVVFYSDGWKKGGGVDNLGSGLGVYATVYDSRGNKKRNIDIADEVREWWPMIAGSASKALLAWQQFVPDETYSNLKISVLNPATGEFTEPVILRNEIQYYTYKVAYVPVLDRFLVTGTTNEERGFAYLIDEGGHVTASLDCMPSAVREAGIVVNGNMAYTPSADNRLLHLALTKNSITLKAVQPSPIEWSYVGSVGLMRNAHEIHWISLTKTNLQENDFMLDDAVLPTAVDRCE